ncbi:hypothetical protein V8E51_006692 [Hyaloscypha variabilis]
MTILKTVGRHPTRSDIDVLEKKYVNDGTATRQRSREPWLYLGYRHNWRDSGGMPRMISLLQPNIEETLNPVRWPMQFGVHSRTLAWEKCRANINVRSTESDSFETARKTLSTYHEVMPNQSAICNLAPRYPAACHTTVACCEVGVYSSSLSSPLNSKREAQPDDSRISACEDELLLALPGWSGLSGLSWIRSPLEWTDVVSRPESSDERMFWLAQPFAGREWRVRVSEHETRFALRDSCSKVEPATTDRRNVNDR